MKAIQSIIVFLVLLCGAAVLGAQTPEWQWAVSVGGSGYAEGESIAADSQGNQYVTGYYYRTVSFGSHSLTASEIYFKDIFVAKLDSDGNWLWAASAGGVEEDYGNSICVDGAGNAYVTGCFEGTVTFGSQTLISNGQPDLFIAKLDHDGNWLWAVSVGGTAFAVGYGISVNAGGDIWLAVEY